MRTEISPRAELPQEAQPVAARQHDVEHQPVVGLRGRQLEGRVAVAVVILQVLGCFLPMVMEAGETVTIRPSSSLARSGAAVRRRARRMSWVRNMGLFFGVVGVVVDGR